MDGYTAEQIRAKESPLLAVGVPLMARAAAALAGECAALLVERRGGVQGARVLVLAGAGDNGGDALFAAAHLAQRGALVTVLSTASRVHEAGLAAASGAGGRMVGVGGEQTPGVGEIARREAAMADLVLDGILGIGAQTGSGLRGRARAVVAAILPLMAHPPVGADGAGDIDGNGATGEARRPLVVAVDLPSGVGADDGSVADEIVLAADVTVTFGGVKRGLLVGPGRRLAGRVVLARIW